jgi:2-hydroxy-3-keto-5-methylthiopentenyl-1-phosphate phosphatase
MRIFFDFDNTVTLGDVLNDLIERYSINSEWTTLEKAWVLGEITTKECLVGQMKWIRISKQELNKYLKTVQIDPYFSKLIELLRRRGIESFIVSDNFEPIIQMILDNHGIKDVPIYANHLRFYKDHIFPSFPYQNSNCSFCAHCKKVHFMNDIHSMNDPIIYIGDGRSDICAAKEADIVFAKNILLEYFRKHNLPCIEFGTLETVYQHLSEKAFYDQLIRR